MSRLLTALLSCVLLCAAEPVGFWIPPQNAAALEAETNAALTRARAARDRLLAVQGARTIENTLVPYDEMVREMGLAGSPTVLEELSPDASIRDAARKMSQAISALSTEVSLDARVYKALAALEPVQKLDVSTAHYLATTLKSFRTAGVDKDDATRAEIAAVRAELVKLQQEFSRNIVEGQATMAFAAADLEGVPADYAASHKKDADGNILVANDRTDIEPLVFYARNPEVRKKAHLFSADRGYPKNIAVLAKLTERRYRLAQLAGFPNFVEMQMQSRMTGTAAAQRQFLEEADEASRAAADKQRAALLEAKRKEQPGAEYLESWDTQYFIRKVRDQRYQFTEQAARNYFPYAQVKASVLETASKLFGISFRPIQVAVWHPTVEAYAVVENGAVIGRVYLDMFPRPNKYQHFASSSYRRGVEGKQLPEGVLMCNFQPPGDGDPGLMTPSSAQTYLHEFGHLLHNIFSGRQRWAGLGRPENDFIEAPSQLMEEWFVNPKVLAGFAKHYKTGEPIPVDMVQRMRRAEQFGEALLQRTQLWYANASMAFEAGDGQVDLESTWRELYPKYVGPHFPEGNHMVASFTHLGSPGYAGAYYTYQWSLAIAKDLFSKFDDGDLMDPKPARRYREAVLNPGGSLPAAKLVENFLGRPFNLKAYQKYLQAE